MLSVYTFKQVSVLVWEMGHVRPAGYVNLQMCHNIRNDRFESILILINQNRFLKTKCQRDYFLVYAVYSLNKTLLSIIWNAPSIQEISINILLFDMKPSLSFKMVNLMIKLFFAHLKIIQFIEM